MDKPLRAWSVRQFAVLGISAQFLALVRILSEVFRLKFFDRSHYILSEIEPFVGTALFTTVLTAIGVAAFARGRVREALTIAVFNVVALFIYRVVFM